MNKLMLSIAILALTVSAAGATVLWDQSTYRTDGAGYWDSESPGMWGGGQIYGACDFTLNADATITSITTYYTNTGAWAVGTYPALFDIYPKTGPTPITGTDDPLIAANVNVAVADLGGGVFSVTCTGLSKALTAGDYWVLLSPIAPQGVIGTPEYHLFYDGAVIGDTTCFIEFGGMFPAAWTPNYEGMDGSILIEGDLVVATDTASFGGVKALYR